MDLREWVARVTAGMERCREACCAPTEHDPADPECVCDACLACDE